MGIEKAMLYEVALKNIPFRQAQSLYRFLVDLHDAEEFHGTPGLSWSGLIEGKRGTEGEAFRTVNLTPMNQVIDELHRVHQGAHAIEVLRLIREELSHGATANFEFIEKKFKEVLD